MTWQGDRRLCLDFADRYLVVVRAVSNGKYALTSLTGARYPRSAMRSSEATSNTTMWPGGWSRAVYRHSVHFRGRQDLVTSSPGASIRIHTAWRRRHDAQHGSVGSHSIVALALVASRR